MPSATAIGKTSHRAQFGEQRQDHALEGARHDETDIEQDADAHEHQAGDQTVAEHHRVDRLQPVDLQHIHHRRRFRTDQGVDEHAFPSGRSRRTSRRH
jgi:hypothetical protein